MTAEVAVMNRQGLALAADSAITVETNGGRHKATWPSADKIFGLSHKSPVAIMVYGNTSLLGIPWETLIKMYRDHPADQRFSHLHEYAEHLLQFIESSDGPFSRDDLQHWFERRTDAIYHELFEIAKDTVFRRYGDPLPVGSEELCGVIEEVIRDRHAATLAVPELPSAANLLRSIRTEQSDCVGRIADRHFRNISFRKSPVSLSEDTFALLAEIPSLLITRGLFSEAPSGLVVAGFGEDEHFPHLEHFTVDSIYAHRLIYTAHTGVAISNTMRASIIPFAQHDVVNKFLTGADEFYETYAGAAIGATVSEWLRDFLTSALSHDNSGMTGLDIVETAEAEWKKLQGALGVALRHQRTKFHPPIEDCVDLLPKHDLGGVAEALVSLTSVRRKLSRRVENVVGPVDIAIVSKGDGFVWVKRKTYFDLAQNQHFLARYLRV